MLVISASPFSKKSAARLREDFLGASGFVSLAVGVEAGPALLDLDFAFSVVAFRASVFAATWAVLISKSQESTRVN